MEIVQAHKCTCVCVLSCNMQAPIIILKKMWCITRPISEFVWCIYMHIFIQNEQMGSFGFVVKTISGFAINNNKKKKTRNFCMDVVLVCVCVSERILYKIMIKLFKLTDFIFRFLFAGVHHILMQILLNKMVIITSSSNSTARQQSTPGANVFVFFLHRNLHKLTVTMWTNQFNDYCYAYKLL